MGRKMQTAGDLTTAYTTIDSNGSIVMQNIQQGKSIKLNPQECSLKIVGPVSVLDDSVKDGTYIPSNDERIELANFEYTIDPDTLCSAIRLIMKSNGMITIDPGDKKISVYSGKDGTGALLLDVIVQICMTTVAIYIQGLLVLILQDTIL